MKTCNHQSVFKSPFLKREHFGRQIIFLMVLAICLHVRNQLHYTFQSKPAIMIADVVSFLMTSSLHNLMLHHARI